MKRMLLTVMLAWICIVGAWSQNANRNGFFLEAAFGGIVGKTPQVAFSVDNYNLKAHTLTGTMVSFALGPRFRISNMAAYELVLELQSPLNAFTSQPTAKLLPIGFRFTSRELFANFSLYGTIRIGGAVGFKGNGNVDLTLPNMPKQDITIHSDSSPTGGPVASLGLGMNITTHFYAGLTWDMQYLFKQYRDLKEENCMWGMVGVRAGYRF